MIKVLCAIGRVAAKGGSLFPAVDQFGTGIGTGCIKEPVPHRRFIDMGRNKRFGDKLLKRFNDLEFIHGFVRCNGASCIKGEGTDQNRESLKDAPLALADEIMAPVQQCT